MGSSSTSTPIDDFTLANWEVSTRLPFSSEKQ
jgi:hypothetical protein